MPLENLFTICLAMIENEQDQHKFEILYHQYRKLLYHVARTRLQDEQLIEEAVCTAFVRVAQNMSMIHEPISEKTMHLLMVIVRRVAIDLGKKQQRDNSYILHLEEAKHLSVEIQTEESDQIASALSRLPHPYKDILLLKFAYGYSNREIACFLDFTVSKVEKLISRGRKRLKIILEQEERGCT